MCRFNKRVPIEHGFLIGSVAWRCCIGFNTSLKAIRLSSDEVTVNNNNSSRENFVGGLWTSEKALKFCRAAFPFISGPACWCRLKFFQLSSAGRPTTIHNEDVHPCRLNIVSDVSVKISARPTRCFEFRRSVIHSAIFVFQRTVDWTNGRKFWKE